MKKIITILSLALIFMATEFSSCGKGGNSPVDQYIQALDDATKKIQDLNDSENINPNDMPPQAALEIAKEYSDYQLTDKDKERIKKSFDKLVSTAFDKVADSSAVPDAYKSQLKEQSKLVEKVVNQHIDESTTLGELGPIQ